MGDFSAGEMRQFGCVLLWDDLRGRRGASAGGRRGRDGERRPRAGDSVAEVGPNYTLLRSKETKAKRRKRQREDGRAALNGHTVLPTGSRLEIFCDTERWYPATVMGREEDGDGRIAHQVEYDGYPDRRWWHMLDDERWRAVPEQAGTGAGGADADVDGDAAMDRADGEGARAVRDAEAAEAMMCEWV